MTEEAIWKLIVEDVPREWLVFVDGSYYTRENSTMARLRENVRAWLTESMIWGMEYGTHKVHMIARCSVTDERVEGDIEVTVTPDMGESTMA